jgi:hypothetical protein
MVCELYVVIPVESHVVEYVFGDEVEVMREPILVIPSSMNWTPTTPTSSVDVAESEIDKPATVAPLEGIFIDTKGAIVSFVVNDAMEPVLVPAKFTA